MIPLQRIVDKLKETPPELRSSVIAELGADNVREAWRSCADATILAGLASLLLTRTEVASGLAACVRELLSRLDLDESAWMDVVAAAERSPHDPGWMSDLGKAMEAIGPTPPPEDAAYDAYAAIVNLHKFLLVDEEKGVQGVLFFCVESTLSKDHPTWESAMRRVADVFRTSMSTLVDNSNLFAASAAL
jgi:hypothetical protein